jgi:aspartate--ammonia ligase
LVNGKRRNWKMLKSDIERKKADVSGPGIGSYAQVEKVLPKNYNSVLNPKETQRATFAVKS